MKKIKLIKNLLFVASLIGNVFLFYQHSVNNADLYDASEKAKFFQNQVKENKAQAASVQTNDTQENQQEIS